MTPVLYYVYRLAATQQFPHVEDLLAEYENGNELDGWIDYFKQEDERLLKMLTTAFSSVRPARGVPQAPARQEKEPVIDMTDSKNQESFVKFVTGQK